MTEEQLRAAEAQVAHETAKKINSQRKQAVAVFSFGTVVLIATIGMALVGSLAPLFDWGCKTVTIENASPTLVCAEPKPPWGFNLGMLWGIGLYLAAAAFRQVEVGQLGKSWLEKLPGFKGK